MCSAWSTGRLVPSFLHAAAPAPPPVRRLRTDGARAVARGSAAGYGAGAMRTLLGTIVRTLCLCGLVAVGSGEAAPAAAQDVSTAAAGPVDPGASSPIGAEDAEAAPGEPEGAGAAPNALGPSPRPCAEQPGISRIEENVYSMDASLLRGWNGGPPPLLLKSSGESDHRDPTTGRVGVRLRLARCAPLREAGLRSGDIVWRVNGWPVAYLVEETWGLSTLMRWSLGAARRFTFVMSRGGEPITVRWQLRKGAAQAPLTASRSTLSGACTTTPTR